MTFLVVNAELKWIKRNVWKILAKQLLDLDDKLERVSIINRFIRFICIVN